MLRLFELLRDAAVTRRAVRFYEEQGLLLPAGRDQYGRRVYVHSDLMRLKLIRALRMAGLSIAAIRDVLDARAVRAEDGGAGSWLGRVEQALSRHAAELRAQLEAMQRGEQEVLSAISWLSAHKDPQAPVPPAQAPFIVEALLCQPSTLSTAPPARPVPGKEAEGLGFATPTW